MRIHEITDAQGQLELLRTVIDNTWSAIAQQAEQERRTELQRKAKAKTKPRSYKPANTPISVTPPATKLAPTKIKQKPIIPANQPSYSASGKVIATQPIKPINPNSSYPKSIAQNSQVDSIS